MMFSEIDKRSANRHGVKAARRLLDKMMFNDADINVISVNPAVVIVDDSVTLTGNKAELFIVLNHD